MVENTEQIKVIDNKVILNLPNRLYRISKGPLIGLLEMLEFQDVNIEEFLKDIGKYDFESTSDTMTTHEYIISKFNDLGLVEYTDDIRTVSPYIPLFFDNMYNPIFLDSLIKLSAKIYYESLPVSSDNLYASVTEILKKMDITVSKQILYDLFYAVYVTDKNEPDVPISYMHQDFKFNNSLGEHVLNAVLDRKKLDKGFYLIFEVDSHEDKVIIDTSPSNFDKPIYVEGNDISKTKVSEFINKLRKEKEEKE